MKLTATLIALFPLALVLSSCAEPTEAPSARPAVAVTEQPEPAPAGVEAEMAPVPDLPVEKPSVEKPVEPAKPTPATMPAAPATRPATRPATTEPTTAPSGPPRVIVTVGETKVMSDRLDEALAGIKRRLAARKKGITSKNLASELERAYRIWIEESLINDHLRKYPPPPEAVEFAKRTIARPIIRGLIIGEYRKDKQSPPRAEVEAKTEERMAIPEEVAKALESYKMRRRLDDEGLELALRQRAKRELATTPENLAEFVASRPVSFFDGTRLKVKHILISYKFYDPQEGRKAAEEAAAIAKTIRSGTLSFEKLAAIHSDDPVSARKRGVYGPVRLPDIPSEKFALVADTLEPGKVRGPFKTFFGWHIIEMIERTEGDGKLVDEKAQRIAKRVLQRQADRDIIVKSLKENPVTVHEDPSEVAARQIEIHGTEGEGDSPTSRPGETRPQQ